MKKGYIFSFLAGVVCVLLVFSLVWLFSSRRSDAEYLFFGEVARVELERASLWSKFGKAGPLDYSVERVWGLPVEEGGASHHFVLKIVNRGSRFVESTLPVVECGDGDSWYSVLDPAEARPGPAGLGGEEDETHALTIDFRCEWESSVPEQEIQVRLSRDNDQFVYRDHFYDVDVVQRNYEI